MTRPNPGRLLDLGCGRRTRPGSVGVDRNPGVSPDVVADLDAYPYPFADSSFDDILLDNVLEHLEDVPSVMTELYRIASDRALVKIIVPYFRSQWAAVDPTHRHAFTLDSMGYFDRNHPFYELYGYAPVDFRVERVTFNEGVVYEGRTGVFVGVVTRYAHRHPERYERWLSSLVPLDSLCFELRVVKPR